MFFMETPKEPVSTDAGISQSTKNVDAEKNDKTSVLTAEGEEKGVNKPGSEEKPPEERPKEQTVVLKNKYIVVIKKWFSLDLTVTPIIDNTKLSVVIDGEHDVLGLKSKIDVLDDLKVEYDRIKYTDEKDVFRQKNTFIQVDEERLKLNR